MKFIDVFKKFSLDFGQGSLRQKTAGKRIANSLIRQGTGKKALDAGCREGFQSRMLEEKGYSVVSVDITKAYHKAQIIDLNKNLPFEDQSFDLVWMSEVIEHLNSPSQVILELKRILKNKGELIVTTPNSSFWLFRLFSLFGISPKKLQHKGHKHFFNIYDIKKLFPQAQIFGFCGYLFYSFQIKKAINFLSPTFIIYDQK